MDKLYSKLDKILRVNLTDGDMDIEPIERNALKFIGGRGLAAYYFLKEQKPKTDPFSSENKLVFAWGPLTALAPATSRFAVVTKSPLTGTFLDTYSGGTFPAKLRFSLPECAAILFEGRAERLTYLEIEDGHAELKDAEHLRGKSILDLYEIFGNFFEVACIGVAGENRVRYATVSSDRGVHHAGRGGAGAVMGSKNLKCVVAKGEPPELPKEIKGLLSKYSKKLREHSGTQWAIESGTAGTLASSQDAGILPTNGWKMGTFEEYDKMGTVKVKEARIKRQACYRCPLGCGYSLKLKGTYDIETLWGPEYESIAMLGPNCGISDLSSIATISSLCDKFGIDTIETGAMLGWLMRCTEEGVVDFNIKFGDVEKSMEIIKKIAYRENELGYVLADGIKKAVSVYGGEEFAVECKGMNYPAYDPRGSVGMALSFATSDRGACHKRSWTVGPTTFWGKSRWDFEAQPKIVKEDQDKNSLLWCLTICDFARDVYLEDLGREWLQALGYNYTVDQLEALGGRIWDMVRTFNVREGFSRKDDYMPDMMTKALGGEGPAKGRSIRREDFEKMLDSYYKLRGWTKEGIPEAQDKA